MSNAPTGLMALTNSQRPLLRALRLSTCLPCRHLLFSTTPSARSGHNKWSKIKHGKAANDAKKLATRDGIAKSLTRWSKSHGPDPDFNPGLAATIAKAKDAGVPKAVISAAIERGQGRSPSGATLESMTLEAMVPPSVALIVDVETDNKLRSLQDLNHTIKKGNGTTSKTKFFFTRQGRIDFEPNEIIRSPDDLLDYAIDAGAEDLSVGQDGNITVWTQPNLTNEVGNALQEKCGLKIASSELVWLANKDTKVKIDQGEEADTLAETLAVIQQNPDVRAIFANIEPGNLAEEEWSKIAENIDL